MTDVKLLAAAVLARAKFEERRSACPECGRETDYRLFCWNCLPLYYRARDAQVAAVEAARLYVDEETYPTQAETVGAPSDEEAPAYGGEK